MPVKRAVAWGDGGLCIFGLNQD